MSGGVLVLILASAVAHAAWNALLKRSRDPENVAIGMMVVCAGSTLLAAVVLFKLGSPLATTLTPRATLFSAVSGLLEAGYFITLARALQRAPLGPVYTLVRGGALLLIWPVSVTLLDEPVTISRGFGTLLVMLGLAAAGRPSSQATATMISGLGYAALCSLFVGGYSLAYKLALRAEGAPASASALSLCSAALINVVAIGRRRARVVVAVRAELSRTMVGGLLGNIGFLVFLIAMRDAHAGVVVTLRNTSILFAQLFAFLLGERPTRIGLIGALAVTAGAVLLAR